MRHPHTVRRPRLRARKGFAVVAVLLIAMVGAVLALASAVMAMSNTLVQTGSDRTMVVDDAAISGLEYARARLNAKLDTVPLESYKTMESNATISGTSLKRSIWVSRLGNADSLRNVGEFGVQAEVVVKTEDQYGNVAIRRAQMFQESFARYASFTDQGKMANGSTLYWALGAQATGPVHSNDTIFVWNGAVPNPQAVFNDVVTTAKIVKNKTYATFRKGAPQENISVIPMPTSGDLNILKTIATRAGYAFTPNVTGGDSALATMRIEFVAIDVNGDGDVTDDDEGYFKVYQLRSVLPAGYHTGYTLARPPVPPSYGGVTDDSVMYSPNCGVTSVVGGRTAVAQTFSVIARNDAGADYTAKMLARQTAFDDANARCFLGGDDRLSPTGVFRAVDSAGYWMARAAGSVPAAIAARADGAYLWPLSPSYNPNFRGVIFVEGKTAVSGTVRGRVTIAARNIINIAHELVQATSPGTTSGTCKPEDDVIGLFSGEYVMYSNNMLAAPMRRRTSANGSTWGNRKEFDPSSRRPDISIHASMLALKSVAAEGGAPPAGLPAAQYVTLGTTRVIGGTIEARAGLTGTMSGTSLHGYNDDLSYNACLLQYPPPYFPTTGRWTRSQIYEVNPVGFSPGAWFTGR